MGPEASRKAVKYASELGTQDQATIDAMTSWFSGKQLT